MSKVVLADIARLKADPERVTLSAVGVVPTLGWSDASLLPHMYIARPIDDIVDFHFNARVPPRVARVS
jgi:hypothetical protein